MTDTLRSKLDRIYADDVRQQHETLADQEPMRFHARYQTAMFENKRRDLIRPRMEELACFLADRLISTTITQNERRYDLMGRLIGSVGITIRAFVNSSPGDVINDIPHYAVYWEPLNSAVRFYRNSNARHMAGELALDGRANLHELSSDMIEGKLLRFARAIT